MESVAVSVSPGAAERRRVESVAVSVPPGAAGRQHVPTVRRSAVAPRRPADDPPALVASRRPLRLSGGG